VLPGIASDTVPQRIPDSEQILTRDPYLPEDGREEKGDCLFMKNKYLARFLCITLVSAMIAAVPFTTLAVEYEDRLVTAQDWTETLVSENGADPDDWIEEEFQEAEPGDQTNTGTAEEVQEDTPASTPEPEPAAEPEPGPEPEISATPEPAQVPTTAPEQTEENTEKTLVTTVPEQGDVFFEEEGDPSSEGLLFAYSEAPVEDPEQDADSTATPTVTPTGTPTPTPTATPTPTPSPLPSPAVRIGLTTSMVSNLHAGKEFYLTSLSTVYGLSFSENFPQIMDQIENEYLAKNHLKRSDSEGLLSRDWQDVIAIYLYEQSKLGRKVFNLGNSDKADLARIFAYLNPIMQTGPDVGDDASRWDYSKEHYYNPEEEKKNQKRNRASGVTEDLFSDSDEPGVEEEENRLTDALWWQIPVEDPDGALTEIVLESAVDPSLFLENPDAAIEPVNPAGLFDSGSSGSGRISHFGNKPVAYANRHINYYIRDNNISKNDRSLLKKYTETDCKLLCATVTAAKGFVRQSVGDNVSEERVDVISAAYSLVGKVGYFWGGKSTYLGEDPAWGTVGTVTASGSNSTGTLRSYGLDCSGFVTWAVINGYEDKAMQAAIGDGTSAQWENAKVVTEANAQPGDLVFQRGPEAGSDNHVGILVGKTDSGDWIAVHCSSSQNGVTVGEAYSASFRYIREPAFYPEKTEPANIVLEENIDDILVDADLPGGTGSTQGTDFSLFDDDFLDVVVVDGNESAGHQDTGAAENNTALFDPYDPFMDTGGLVVLDETGPIAPEFIEETDSTGDTENAGNENDSDFIGPQLLIEDEPDIIGPQLLTEDEPDVIGPQLLTEDEPDVIGPQLLTEDMPEAGPVVFADEPDAEPTVSVDETEAEPIVLTDEPDAEPTAFADEDEAEPALFADGTDAAQILIGDDAEAVQVSENASQSRDTVMVIYPEEAGPMPAAESSSISAIDVDQTIEETFGSVQEEAETAQDASDVTEESPAAVEENEDQPAIEKIDIDAALASEDEPYTDKDIDLEEDTVPEEVMELVVLEGLDWDDFDSDEPEEPEVAQQNEEAQGPVYQADQIQKPDPSQEVIVIDPELFGDNTPTPGIPVLEIYPQPTTPESTPEGAVFDTGLFSEDVQSDAPVMEIFDKNGIPEEQIVVIDPSSDTFSSGDLFSSQEWNAQTAIVPGETVVDQEVIQIVDNPLTVTPTGTPVPKSFFSILAGLFQ